MTKVFISKRTPLLITLFILALVSVVITIPICCGYLTGHDYHFHLKWAWHFNQQFWSGEIYPRWLRGMNAGIGSPVFFFYAPVPFWIDSLFPPWVAGSLHATAAQLGKAALFETFISGLTFYLWRRRYHTPLYAMLGAMAYLLLPYHVLIDLHWRFAYAEFVSFAWAPLLFYFIDRMRSGEPYGLQGVALSYALVVMTHLLSALMVSIAMFGYLIVFVPPWKDARRFLRIVCGLLLGCALSGIYLLPALTMQDYIAMPATLWSDAVGYDALNNFLFYGPRVNDFEQGADGQSSAMFWELILNVVLMTAGVGLVSAAISWSRESRRQLTFWVVVILASVFLMHPVSKPLWQLFSLLQVLQFPWRLTLVETLAASILFGFAMQAVFERANPIGISIGVALAVAVLIPWLVAEPEYLRQVKSELHIPDYRVHNDYETFEYRPVEVPEDQWTRIETANIGSERSELISTSDDTATWKVLSNESRAIEVVVGSKKGTYVELRQFRFVAWRATLDGHAAAIYSSSGGRCLVKLPAGTHQLRFELIMLPAEKVGSLLTLLALSFLVGTSVSQWIKTFGRRQGVEPSRLGAAI